MKALWAYKMTSTDGENFATLPDLISSHFDVAPETAEKLFRSSVAGK